mmetsp:Transcript_55881/g.88548  ORF Transcript_55881/g.88548 Transcript_55881/m.88548 type:complete len:175 (+) Transcript_55881:41-565(+)|eukprot:CAMPEP_0169179284 /NCGR_PEP_ID=MMETSP1015-20121227/67557_1 /TAXON_ID=342587 /ORGANISM="Karlodinium micrum, Strain CCMP2283" /LENGTH=174 /DNA_ID=CAMNT_0009254319 /DNA_START=40 /DNA_END=564 /DNA_ORIENTATION=+
MAPTKGKSQTTAKSPAPQEQNKPKKKSSKSSIWSSQWRWAILLMIPALILIVMFFGTAASAPAPKPPTKAPAKPPNTGAKAKNAPNSRFVQLVPPMVRAFIAANYVEYGKGKTTLRHLKQHIVDKAGLGLTYEDLRDDRYSAVIEDEADAIAGRCEGGQQPVSCVGDEPIEGEL